MDERTATVATAPEGAEQWSVVVFRDDSVVWARLADGKDVVVGRAPPADLVVEDPSLSRQHAGFRLVGDRVEVQDLGSRNGTWIEGRRMERGELGAGSECTLGNVVVVVQHAGRRRPAPRGLLPLIGLERRLDEEVERARVLKRGPSVVACALDASDLELLLGAFRSIDRASSYMPGVYLALFGEIEPAELRARLGKAGERGRLGIVSWPEATTSAGLVEAAISALRRATDSERVVFASNGGQPSGARPIALGSESMKRLETEIDRLAPTMLSVVIRGETGVGKELVARALHDRSTRRRGPFRALNCGAIPASLAESTLFGHERGAFTGADRRAAGVFEQASRGTLFLDEIAELPGAIQAALLRVLETGRLVRVGGSEEVAVDVRVVAASHRDLEQLASTGAFRWDLFYRLAAATLVVAPLRERPDDVEQLARAFVALHGPGRDLDADAVEALRAHSWPGNVRELRNVMDRAVAVARGPRVGVSDLPDRVLLSASAGGTSPVSGEGELDLERGLRTLLDDVERQAILEALRRTGKRAAAARLLQIPLRTLAHKMTVLGLSHRWTERDP